MSARQRRQIELVAIDLDGTLLDSVGDLHAAVNIMQHSVGHTPASLEQVEGWIGNGVERLVHRALTGSMSEDAADALFRAALTEFKRAYHEVNGRYVTVYPGVVDGLEWLHSKGLTISVVTNKSREFTVPLLEKTAIAGYFSHIVCGDDVQHKKPAPDSLLLSAEQAKAHPTACLMVGDSINDFIAARNAGFTLVGVSYGYNHGIALNQLTGNERPDFNIDSFTELPAVVRKLT
ncbi:MAG: phosphoglycolate phosphatase [Granulosicoccus sp.]